MPPVEIALWAEVGQNMAHTAKLNQSALPSPHCLLPCLISVTPRSRSYWQRC